MEHPAPKTAQDVTMYTEEPKKCSTLKKKYKKNDFQCSMSVQLSASLTSAEMEHPAQCWHYPLTSIVQDVLSHHPPASSTSSASSKAGIFESKYQRMIDVIINHLSVCYVYSFRAERQRPEARRWENFGTGVNKKPKNLKLSGMIMQKLGNCRVLGQTGWMPGMA